MSIPVFTAAMMLASAPVGADAALPVAPAPAAAVPASTAAAETPVAPAISAETSAAAASTAPAPASESDFDAGQNSIVVMARRHAVPGDPLAVVNAESFAVVQSVDHTVVAPVSRGYEHGVPRSVRHGLRNFLRNLEEPVVFANFLLQHRVGKAAATLGRFTVNSSLGVAGLFDVAKRRPFNLAYRQNGFANSMAFYGMPTGPYMFLPLIGPTTLRDVAGRIMDMSLLPMIAGKPFNQPAYTFTAGVVRLLNDRVDSDARVRKLQQSDDPYAAFRAEYLQRRKVEVEALHGKRHNQAAPAAEPAKPVVEQSAPPAPSATDVPPLAPATSGN